MCITKVEYNCKHKTKETKPCPAYRDLCRRVKKANRNHSLWSCLFFPSKPTCTAKSGKKSIFRDCDACERQARHEDREKRRQQLARQQWDAQTKQKIQERGCLERKWRYRCERCVNEGRRPDERTRAANGGLCCARGLQEFSERERKKTRHRRPARTHQTVAPRPAHLPTREERFPELQRLTSQQKMRIDATKAADRYGWSRTTRTQQRDSEYLEAGLVKDYMNTPGADPRIVGRGPPVPEPLYEEPGIEWERWDRARQGNHGRLPPMPESPLPIIPLKTRRTRHVSSIERKPIPCRKHSVESRCDPVSPLSSPASPSPSPVSPERSQQDRKLRSVMSNLNHDISDALDDWRMEPMPPPPTRWRQAQW